MEGVGGSEPVIARAIKWVAALWRNSLYYTHLINIDN